MDNEVVSDKQGIALIILFIIGSSSIVVPGLAAKIDVWIAIILSVLIALPMALISSRLHDIFPERDLFDIIEICFGKFIGKVIILLFTWFVFELSAQVLRNFSQFVTISSLDETPLIVPMISIGILIIFLLKKGIYVMSRWSETVIVVPISLIFLTSLLLIPKMNINNIRPVLYNGINPVLKGAFGALSFPFGQTVLFTMFFSKFERRKSPYKVYTIGLLIGGLLLLITSLTNILVLESDTASILYFPSLATSSIISIGNSAQRFEVISAIIFITGQFLKISLLILCSCKGISKIFGCNDYRFIATPMVLLMINVCYLLHDSIMDFYEWVAELLPYYSLPFQVFFPIIIWITAEIKKKSLDKSN